MKWIIRFTMNQFDGTDGSRPAQYIVEPIRFLKH